MLNQKHYFKKERLDTLIVMRGLVDSRTKAQALIMAGQVKVGGVVERKAGREISPDKTVELLAPPRYVSRGGEKLEGALKDLGVDPRNLICMDVGASTGGFTDCLLQAGAKKVFAVDVGTAQINDRLKNDDRVFSIEKTHIRDLRPEQIGCRVMLAVIDVSFISLTRVIQFVKPFLEPDGRILALVKPQFEVGPKLLKKGVVRSEEARLAALADVIRFSESQGFRLLGQAPSRLKGPKGNQEYFVLLYNQDNHV